MDNLTHTLFGATLARTPLGRAGRGTTAALLLASNAPDIDIVTATNGSTSYLRWHRGPTHGLLGIVVLGVATAGVVWAGQRLVRRKEPEGSAGRNPSPGRNASFAMLCAVSMIAVAFHILMDVPTAYGTRVLSPFGWTWYAADWLPIIDIYLLVILGAGLISGWLAPARRRSAATLALALMAGNYGLRAAAHHEALAAAPRLFGPLLPAACEPTAPVLEPSFTSWPRRPPSSRSGRPCLVQIAAMPGFLSPFRWRIVAQMSNGYELHDVDLLDARLHGPDTGHEVFWRMSIRYPNLWTPSVERAAATDVGHVFLGFSRFPAARSFVAPSGETVVHWNDMRFAGGIFTLSAPRRPDPFTVTVRIAADGQVVEQRLGR
ncbi:MAG: metal-dependent hydrolase [Betaproteobacteria bacterium]